MKQRKKTPLSLQWAFLPLWMSFLYVLVIFLPHIPPNLPIASSATCEGFVVVGGPFIVHRPNGEWRVSDGQEDSFPIEHEDLSPWIQTNLIKHKKLVLKAHDETRMHQIYPIISATENMEAEILFLGDISHN